jgi:anti-sigma regulatory factor (Ser/Thr protein kinase)
MTIVPPMLARLKGADASVARAIESLERFAHRAGLPQELRNDLSVIVDEVVSNLLKYGGVKREELDLEIRASIEGSELVLCFTDSGPPFDPLSAKAPVLELPIEERLSGGLGIHLFRALTDSQRYARENGRNVLVLTRSIGR